MDPRPLLFLGSTADTNVLWDCRAKVTYFVAKGDAHIELFRMRGVGYPYSSTDLRGDLGGCA